MKRIRAIRLLGVLGPGLAAQARAEDIRDVKPPVNPPPDLLLLFLALIVVLALLCFYGIRAWRRKRQGLRKEGREMPAPDPWTVAMGKLTALKDENLPALGRVKEYYIGLSGIIRHYIEERFDIRAPEMTTEEFLFCAKSSGRLTPGQKQALEGFLSACDRVKFAKYAPGLEEMIQSFDAAWRFVEETRSPLLPEGHT